MKFFKFFADNKNAGRLKNIVPDHIDKSHWTGKDFYFLITGDLHWSAEGYENLMTNASFEWEKISSIRPFYKVDKDEFGFFKEKDLIQLEFNDDIPYQKARKMADDIIGYINRTGVTAELLVAGKPRIYLSSENAF